MTRVFIVSDIRIYCEGLALALAASERLTVVGTLGEVGQLRAALASVSPHVVLIDMGMPDAIDTVRAVRRRLPAIKLVALGVRENASAVLRCAEAGLEGYVSRQASVAELVDAVESVQRDEVLCPPKIVGALFRHLGRLSANAGGDLPGTRLTPRELQVLGLINEGLSNKQIASRLNIQTATAKNHVHNALEKLGVHQRGEAAAMLRRAGLLPARR